MRWQQVRRCEVIVARSFVIVGLVWFLGAVEVTRSAQAEVVAESRRPSVSQQLKSMRKSLALIRRSMASLRKNGDAANTTLTEVKDSVATLNQRIVTGTLSEATPTPTPVPGRVIAASEPTSSYIAFDKYETRRGQATVQHSKTGIVVWFRILEGGKNVQEYKLNFPFAGRTADQKAADAMVINNCMSQFYRAFDATDGTFYIYASADDTLGVLCASDVYAR